MPTYTTHEAARELGIITVLSPDDLIHVDTLADMLGIPPLSLRSMLAPSQATVRSRQDMPKRIVRATFPAAAALEWISTRDGGAPSIPRVTTRFDPPLRMSAVKARELLGIVIAVGPDDLYTTEQLAKLLGYAGRAALTGVLYGKTIGLPWKVLGLPDPLARGLWARLAVDEWWTVKNAAPRPERLPASLEEYREWHDTVAAALSQPVDA